MKLINQLSSDIITLELEAGAIYNDDFQGFHQDYLVMQSLMKLHKPKTVFEYGTHYGLGTYIICNAVGKDTKVFSLDLAPNQKELSKQYPSNIGHKCKLPFTQLLGDSRSFDITPYYPIDAFYCDAEHTTEAVYAETTKMLNAKPKLIVWHDTDIPEVMAGLQQAFDEDSESVNYDLFRVTDTRISYAVRK